MNILWCLFLHNLAAVSFMNRFYNTRISNINSRFMCRRPSRDFEEDYLVYIPKPTTKELNQTKSRVPYKIDSPF